MTRRPGMLLPLEVAYDDFTVDIPENRILRVALRLMLQVTRLSDDVRWRLVHLDSKLDGVFRTETRGSAAFLDEVAAERAVRSRAAVGRDYFAEHVGGGRLGSRTAASFVVNMATVFEDFLTTVFEVALGTYPGDYRAISGIPRRAGV